MLFRVVYCTLYDCLLCQRCLNRAQQPHSKHCVREREHLTIIFILVNSKNSFKPPKKQESSPNISIHILNSVIIILTQSRIQQGISMMAMAQGTIIATIHVGLVLLGKNVVVGAAVVVPINKCFRKKGNDVTKRKT